MPDFSMKRSEYMRIMMGNRKDALAPYRPDQMNDLGDTSFDVASLSDEDINSAIAQMQGSKYERSDIFKSLQTEQTSRKEKAEQEKRDKPWYEAIGDFFSNIGTSITEGVLNVVDDVWDFTIGIAGGIGGGWFGQENDFTDWVASAITDDRWINTATKALTFANPIEMATNIGNGQYWNGFWDWTPENLEKQYAENYEGMEWLRTGGNFVGEIIPSLVLAYFTGGASLGVQAAVQGGLGLARGMGNAQSRALSESASFQQAAGYGAVKGAISGALSAGLTYAGGTFASRGADSIVSKAGNSIGDAVLAKTGSANLSAFANSASKFIIRVAGDAGEAAVLTAIEPAFQQIYNENAWYNAYGTDENRKAYAEQIGRSALTAAAFSAVTNAVRDVWQVHKAGGREAYMEQYERGAYQRLSENEILNSLSRADRRMAREGAAEWQKIQSEIDRVQSEYEAMKAKGASDVDLELFVGKNKEAISKQVGSFSDKYGKLFTKLSAKAHPDALPSTDNAKLAEARSATFQRYSSMTNKGAKEQLSQLFNGKNGIVGLIAYTSGSAPVETIKENDSLVARPKNFEQVQSVLAAAAEDGANAPAVLELPLKNGNNVRLDISVIAPKQLEGIAFLSDSDFKTLPDGNRVADLGDRKSFVISKDGTRVMVLNSSEIDDFDHLTKAITLPDGSKASLVEYVDGLVKSDRSLEFSVEENESGKYLKYGGQGLNGFSQEDKVRILKMYLTKKYQNTEIALDGDSISVTRQSVKKLGKFSGQNLDKAYLELKELGEIAKFDKRVPNMKNKELNAPPYSYYVAKMEIDGSIVNFQFNIRESFDRSPILYAIQEIKNGGVVPGNNSSLAPSTMPVSGGSNSGSALAPATNNIPNAKKDVKSGSKEDSTFVGLAITHDETISLSDYDEKMSIYKPIVKDVIDRLNAIDGDTVSLDEAIGGYTFSSEDALSGYALGGEPSFPLQIDTGDFAEDAIRAFAIGDLAFEIQDTIMVGHFDPAGKNRVFGISLTRVDEGLEDIIAKFKWEGYTLDVKGKSISFVDPDEEQLRTFLIQLIENGYAKPETAKTTADAANVQFAGRSDRLDAYETWLQSHDREQDGELFRFVREAYERLKGSLNGSGQSAVEDTKASSGAKGASLARFRANPSLVKQAANAKVGKVYSLSSVKAMVNAVEDAIQDALSLDNLGGKTAMNIKKGEIAKAFFDTLNLGTQEQKAGLLSILRDKLLGTKVKYKLDDFYGETLDSYEGTLKEFLAVLDEGERAELDAGISKLFRGLEGGGSDSDMKKVIDAFSEKLSALADKYRSLKASTKITGHIEKHRAKMVQRYCHGDVEDFAPGFDFDNQGFRVLVQPLHDFALTAGKQSYTGSSVVKALSNFLDGYKPENFQKADVPVSGDVSMTSQLYNQGLRDLANAIVESIEADNKHVLGNGKVRYDALDARQLAMLRLFQDTIEKMPAQFTKDRLEAVANAQAGYHGVERYVSTVLKGENVGLVRKFIQGYAERYGNQLDTLIYEIGDNVLSRAIVDELYLSQPNDLDLMVFTRHAPNLHRAPRECVCVLRGLRLDVNVYSVSEFDHIEDYEQHNFVHEEGDWEIIYGRPNAVRFHKLDLGEELTKFKAVLFDPYSQDYYPRRLVSFFVLARKLGYDVPQDLIERAHRDEIDPADYRAFFYILFTKYSPKIHHEK